MYFDFVLIKMTLLLFRTRYDSRLVNWIIRRLSFCAANFKTQFPESISEVARTKPVSCLFYSDFFGFHLQMDVFMVSDSDCDIDLSN